MSDESSHSSQNAENSQSIPSREQLIEMSDRDISEEIYNTYYLQYLEFLSGNEGPVGKRDVYKKVTKDVTDNTKKSRLKELFEIYPCLSEKVADLNPSADAFLSLALEQSELEIKPETINSAKSACENLSDEFFDQFIDYHMCRLEERAEQKLDEKLPEEGEISIDRHNEFVREYSHVIVRELPDELTSFNQSMTTIGGKANELITIKSLEYNGMEEDEHFIDVSSDSGSDDNPEDIVIRTEADAKQISVEVKSTATRERASAGLSRLADPSILFGYFENQAELAGNIEELLEKSIAVYAQPETLEEMASQNPSAYETTTSLPHTNHDGEWLFFRANVDFAEDMLHYYETGKLPDRELSY